jgi:hypothetical protein
MDVNINAFAFSTAPLDRGWYTDAKAALTPHLVAKILEYVTIKLLGVVDYYLSRHSEATYYILSEKSLEPRYCDGD